MPPVRKRGPYKQYQQDPEVPIPRTTAWRRAHTSHDIQHDEDVQQPVELIGQVEREADNSSERGLMDGGSEPDNAVSDNEEHANHRMEGEHNGEDGNNLDREEGDSDNLSERGDGVFVSDSESSVDEELQSSDREQDSDVDEDSSSEEEGVLGVENAESDGDEDLAMEREQHQPEAVPNYNPTQEEDNEEHERNHVLYEGCSLTAEESGILIMSFLIRWGLEDKSIGDLLALIDCHLPRSVMGSKHLFLKRFQVPDISKLRFTCPDCFELLPTNFEEGQCDQCAKRLEKTKLKDSGDFFIEMSVTEQVKGILECPSLYPLLRNESGEKDVISGSFYRQLRTAGVIGDTDVTLQWNTDGVSPFKSSKVTVWPIQACINELPFYERKQNMILCGLYFGKKKPYINSFLKPFVEELRVLHTEGFQCIFPGANNSTTVRVHTILASVDSVARCALQGQKQFNGSYGCSFCLRRGMRIERGHGSARVYAGGRAESRTLPQHMDALRQLTEHNRRYRRQKQHVQGVKMPSILLTLPVFDIHASFVPDYLHCVLEGCVKQFLNHWMDGAYQDKDWYLTPLKRQQLDNKLKAILPPVEITRPPGILDDIKLLKASQFYHFLLYYSISCLKGILPSIYIKHWFLLVFALSIYLKESFSDEEALKAKRALEKFVEDIREVYPGCIHLYTFNVHLLLHIPRAADRFGGLWASSTFCYEHFNGVLARFITGTRHIPEQICKSYLRLRMISDSGIKVFSHHDCPEDGKRLFSSLTSKFRSSQYSQPFGDNLRLFNKDGYQLSAIEHFTIEEMLQEGEINLNCLSYRRAIFCGTLYHASFYETLKVRNNSVVKLNNGQYMSIIRILVVELGLSNEKKCIFLGEAYDSVNEVLCSHRDLNISSTNFFTVCHKSDRVTSILPQQILRKCVSVPYGNAECLVPLVNLLERD